MFNPKETKTLNNAKILLLSEKEKNPPTNDQSVNLIIMIQNSRIYFAIFLRRKKNRGKENTHNDMSFFKKHQN